jgi:hypothetical protein
LRLAQAGKRFLVTTEGYFHASPFELSRHEFKMLFANVARWQIRFDRLMQALFHPIAGQRRRYRERVRKWRSVLLELQGLSG